MILKAYHNADLINTCKVIGGSNWEDIRNDIATKMYEMPDERFDKVKSVLGYMIRAAYNIGLDSKRKVRESLIDCDDRPELILEGYDYSRLDCKIKKDCNHPKRFYHAKVFMYVLHYGSVKAFSKEIRIPYKELLLVYNDYKTYLKEWAKRL